MKHTRLLRASSTAVLSTAFLLALAATSHADLTYGVSLVINQADLTSTTGPYSLDFDLTTGSGNVLNTVSISNFQITGGSFTPGTEGNSGSGNISGSLLNIPPAITLSNGYPNNLQLDNEDWAAFGTGGTNISFYVDETNRGDTSPDTFTVALLDDNLNNIATLNSADSQALVYATSAMDSLTSVGYGNSSDPGGVTTSLTVAPEPASAALLLLGAAGLIARRKRTAAPHIA